MLLLLVHVVSGLIYGNAILYDYKLTRDVNLRLPIPDVYFSKFVWLTMINLVNLF